MRSSTAPLWFWVCVAAVGFPLSVFHYATFGSRPPKPSVGSEPDAPDIRFFHRLPREMGRQIISLSMQDHYVRVTTPRLGHDPDPIFRCSQGTRRSCGRAGPPLALSGSWSGEANPAREEPNHDRAGGRSALVREPTLFSCRQETGRWQSGRPIHVKNRSTQRRGLTARSRPDLGSWPARERRGCARDEGIPESCELFALASRHQPLLPCAARLQPRAPSPQSS